MSCVAILQNFLSWNFTVDPHSEMQIVHHHEDAITLQQKGSIIAFSSNISLYIALQHGQNMEPYENSETRETSYWS